MIVGLLAAPGCGGDEQCPPAPPRYDHPAMMADHYVGLAILHLLHEREQSEPARRTVVDERIRGLMMDLCGGTTVGRVDIATTPIEDFFALHRLKEATVVSCTGLIVGGYTAPGRVFPRSDRGMVAPEHGD